VKTEAVIKINTDKRVAALGDLFGIFFEDLNHAADGGLYAELVQNRSFEFDSIDHPDYHGVPAWEKVERGNIRAEIYVEDRKPLNEKNLHYLVIDIKESTHGSAAGVMNLGYNTGIPVRKGENYKFSCYARRDSHFKEPVRIALESINGNVYADNILFINSSEWSKYEVSLAANAEDYSSRLVITTRGTGKIYLDMVSLFPERTFKGRPNGMREDIAQMIADMKPKFMRFPGGCLVHDGSLDSNARDSMYRWKNTIGDIEQRPTRRNNWRYNQSLGIGFYEYFLFCEDIGAKPIPVLPGGYDPHHQRIVPLDELQPWIDDALDLIEFANGDVTTKWGAKRAELGHPEPFGLEYIAIGNEEVGQPFFERYAYFHRAIKEKYPYIKIINTSGPFAAGSEYERGWKSAKENQSDFVDEHYYQSPEWFLANYHRYDNFEAYGPKVFLGEYATWGNTYYNALVEAAFMTGLEKNAHAVGLACYAPLLCNVDYVNWRPDMIWFNNHQVYGTANYYVQKLFMQHQGDYLVQAEMECTEKPEPGNIEPITGRIALAGNQIEARFSDIKVRNNDTGEEKGYSDIFVNQETGAVELGEIYWSNYTLSFKAEKLRGSKGFVVYFGQKDDKNMLLWEIGGWQNQDSIIGANVNGRNSCLTQSLFSVEQNKEYELKLEVNGRVIRTSIDGRPTNEVEDKLPVIEPLYYSATIDEATNDIILKAVNVRDKEISVTIDLKGLEGQSLYGKIYEMSRYELDAENSFENPEFVVPVEKEFRAERNIFEYKFSKHSITVFRFQSKK